MKRFKVGDLVRVTQDCIDIFNAGGEGDCLFERKDISEIESVHEDDSEFDYTILNKGNWRANIKEHCLMAVITHFD